MNFISAIHEDLILRIYFPKDILKQQMINNLYQTNGLKKVAKQERERK